MNRYEALTKTVMEVSPQQLGDDSIIYYREFEFGWNEYQQRRTELINKPDDADAPEWARWKAQEANGDWFWHEIQPFIDDGEWAIYCNNDEMQVIASRGKIPAGHNWRATLTQVNTMTTTAHEDQYTSPEEDAEFARIQARQDSERPHEADARMLDAQLAADIGLKYDPDSVAFKQPRYQDLQGDDWIDEFARTKTVDEFRGAMSFNIGKYNRRTGKKDDVLKEVVKMRDYCQRWEEYERNLLK